MSLIEQDGSPIIDQENSSIVQNKKNMKNGRAWRSAKLSLLDKIGGQPPPELYMKYFNNCKYMTFRIWKFFAYEDMWHSLKPNFD